MKKKLLVAAVVCLAVFGVGARIFWVNSQQTATDYPVEHRQIGEWIDLSGVYFGSSDEDYSGYSIRIDSARVMSIGEYLQEYGAKEIDLDCDLDAQCVVAIGYSIRNDGNESGGLALYDHYLIPSSKNRYYQCDTELWDASQPQLNGTMGFSVVLGTEYSLVAPFTLKYQPRYFDTYENMQRGEVTENSFELVLSNAPRRIVVDVCLS